MAHAKRLCRGCGKRAATFSVRGGREKSDREHDLCRQCFRALRNRMTVSRIQVNARGI